MEKCESVHTDKGELRKKDLLRMMTNNCDLIHGRILQISRNYSIARVKHTMTKEHIEMVFCVRLKSVRRLLKTGSKRKKLVHLQS
jgi:hypothetical protein